MTRIVRFAFTLNLCAGCGSSASEATPAPTEPSAPPAWVTAGTIATHCDTGRIFIGVGSASGIKNVALARTTADNRARAEIAKYFEVYIASLMRDYWLVNNDPTVDYEEEQHVESIPINFSGATLSGVEIVDHYSEPDNTWYAKARLHLDSFLLAVERGGWDHTVKKHILAKAEEAHSRGAGESSLPAPCLFDFTAAPVAGGTCVEDWKLPESHGLLRYVCTGGSAEAHIGNAAFAGGFEEGEVALEDISWHQETCNREVTARLTGTLASGELTLTYTNAPDPREGETHCAATCVVQGSARQR